MFSTVVAMEVVPTRHQKWYIDVNKDVVERFVGSDIRYHNEYKFREFHKENIVSFPVECTDPLPIEYCGDKRFFKTPLMALTILDPAIKQLAIVRGTMQKNHKHIAIYLGLETDNIKLLDNRDKKIYPAKILAYHLEKENDVNSGYWHPQCFSCTDKVAHFGILQILEEFEKRFPKVKNRDWNDYRFQFLCKKLLGKCAQDFNFKTLQFNF